MPPRQQLGFSTLDGILTQECFYNIIPENAGKLMIQQYVAYMKRQHAE